MPFQAHFRIVSITVTFLSSQRVIFGKIKDVHSSVISVYSVIKNQRQVLFKCKDCV